MRKHLIILGGGTAGTIAANKLIRRLDGWQITVIDADDQHHYQPGYLFIPFGVYTPKQVTKSRLASLRQGVNLLYGTIDRVDPDANQVFLDDGTVLHYDALIIASGVTPRPDQTPGMEDGIARGTVAEFYTYDGSVALARTLETFIGRLAIHITEMPIKCPVAPLEFAFLADAYFTKKGVRSQVDITYVTPLPGAFTKPVAAHAFGTALADRNITVVPDFMVMEVDNEANALVAYDDTRVDYDLLVTVPLNMGAEFVARSGLGNELNLVPVDKYTQQSTAHANIFALGDANDIPASKAGSVAHFQIDVFVDNFLQYVAGEEMTHRFDGHANCFIETGGGKAMLIDFNYDTEPLTGTFPLPKVGPMRLLKESRLNHAGKLAFRHLYWHVLLPGRPMGLPAAMTMTGKTRPEGPLS